MVTLPTGWSHGEGLPVSPMAVAVATSQLVHLAFTFDLTADAFPNLDGGCAIAFYNRDRAVEVSVAPDGCTFDVRVERGVGFAFEEVVAPVTGTDLRTVVTHVRRLLGAQWSLLASSTYGSSTNTEDVLGMLYSETQPSQRLPRPLQTAVGGSQSSRPLVPAAR
jgi:hypothetical protein